MIMVFAMYGKKIIHFLDLTKLNTIEGNFLKIAKTCSFSFPSVGRPVVESIPNEEKFGAFCANNVANYFFQNSGANYFKQTFLDLPTNCFPAFQGAFPLSP